jgi:hypothetical protein
MENILIFIPQELTQILCSYLDYTYVQILEKYLNITVDYEELLRNEYPGLYKMVKRLKNEDITYKHYEYISAYRSVMDTEKHMDYIRNLPEQRLHSQEFLNSFNLRTSDVDKLNNTMSTYFLNHGDLKDIRAAYDKLEVIDDKRLLFPNIPNGDRFYSSAATLYEYDKNKSLDYFIDTFSNKLNYESERADYIVQLYQIFLYILNHLNNVMQIQVKLISVKSKFLKLETTNYTLRQTAQIVYQHIMNFINDYIKNH